MSDKEKAAWGYLTWVDKSPDVRPSAEGEEAFFAGAEWGEKQSKWIKCSERLPPIDQDESGNHPHLYKYLQSDRVLAWLKNPDIYDSHVFTGRFVSVLREKHLSRHEQWFEGCSEGSVGIEEVTHWMPLPEAPKEEE